jgi:hypothetical protein
MARGGHGLPKVSHQPAMPYSSMPCGRFLPFCTPHTRVGITGKVLKKAGRQLFSKPAKAAFEKFFSRRLFQNTAFFKYVQFKLHTFYILKSLIKI